MRPCACKLSSAPFPSHVHFPPNQVSPAFCDVTLTHERDVTKHSLLTIDDVPLLVDPSWSNSLQPASLLAHTQDKGSAFVESIMLPFTLLLIVQIYHSYSYSSRTPCSQWRCGVGVVYWPCHCCRPSSTCDTRNRPPRFLSLS